MIIGNFLLGIIAFLFVPLLIVGFWRKHPIWAFVVASLILFTTVFIVGLMGSINVASAYSDGDPQLIAGGIAEAIVTGLIGLVLLGPILFLFQWFVLRRHRRKVPKIDVDKTFS